MFDLYTGSYRELEKAFVDHVLDLRRGDSLSSLLVLSPSAHLLGRLQSGLAAAGPGFVNIHFLGFYPFAERVVSAGPDGGAGKDRLVAEPALYQEVIAGLLEGRSEVDLLLRDAFAR